MGIRIQILMALFPPPTSLRVSLKTLYSGSLGPIFPFCRSIHAFSSERTLYSRAWKALSSILDTSEPQLPWSHPTAPGTERLCSPGETMWMAATEAPPASRITRTSVMSPRPLCGWGPPSTGVTGSELPSAGNQPQDDLSILVSGDG